MSELVEKISYLEKSGLTPGETIKRTMAETGKEAIGCFPIYTPEEIVYAAGYLPVGMWGGQTEIKYADKYLQGFCCSIMRANIELGIKGTYDFLKAVILPTFCDTLKCVCENWKVAVPQVPIIPMVYPQNRLHDFGFDYLVDEFTRVRDQISALSGVEIPDKSIADALKIYEDYRATMREFVETAKDYPLTINARRRHLIIKASYFMDKKAYTEAIAEIVVMLKKMSPEKFQGVRVVLTGLIGEPNILLDAFVQNGICVVADDLAQESRQFRTPAKTGTNVWAKMAFRTIDQKGCAFLFEDQKTRGQLLIEKVKESGADAIIVIMMKFCDPEEFDYPIYKAEIEKAQIPMLYLEIEQQMDSAEQLRTRIQSFVELLKL